MRYRRTKERPKNFSTVVEVSVADCCADLFVLQSELRGLSALLSNLNTCEMTGEELNGIGAILKRHSDSIELISEALNG